MNDLVNGDDVRAIRDLDDGYAIVTSQNIDGIVIDLVHHGEVIGTMAHDWHTLFAELIIGKR